MYKGSSEYNMKKIIFPERFYTASKCTDNEHKLNLFNKKHLDDLKVGGDYLISTTVNQVDTYNRVYQKNNNIKIEWFRYNFGSTPRGTNKKFIIIEIPEKRKPIDGIETYFNDGTFLKLKRVS